VRCSMSASRRSSKAAVLEPWGLLKPSGSTAKEGPAC
jgi:hypothetical protein